MNNDFPKLERLLLRPELEEQDREVWRPTWHCFCCEDTGYVRDVLIKLVISDYNSDKDRNVACRNCGRVFLYARAIIDSLDWRFTNDICARLDRIYRDEWAQTVEKQSQLKRQALGLVDELSEKKSIRHTRRSPIEKMEVRRKHFEIINSL